MTLTAQSSRAVSPPLFTVLRLSSSSFLHASLSRHLSHDPPPCLPSKLSLALGVPRCWVSRRRNLDQKKAHIPESLALTSAGALPTGMDGLRRNGQ